MRVDLEHALTLQLKELSAGSTASLSGHRVYAVSVSSDMQGRGIGSHLMAHLEDRARQSGRVRLRLDVTLTAVLFYLSLG